MRVLFSLVIALTLVGCERGYGFPEDQVIESPHQINSDWQTIRFDSPLEINRSGYQTLSLVLDSDRFRMNNELGPYFGNLIRHDGVMLIPEMVLIGDNGQEVPVEVVSNTRLYAGGVTMSFGPWAGRNKRPSDYPESINTLTAVRLRSNEPFSPEYLQWRMEGHPDLRRCGGRQCAWWEKIYK